MRELRPRDQLFVINVLLSEWRRYDTTKVDPQTGASVSRINLVLVAKLTSAGQLRRKSDRARKT